MESEAGIAYWRKVTKLFSIFTSTPLIGTLEIHFELNPTLKAFNKGMGMAQFFSIYLLENLMSSLVIVMQVRTTTQI